MKCRDQLLDFVEETKEMVYYQQPEDMLALVIATGERKAILAYSATDIREVLDIYSEALSHDGIGETWKDICLNQYKGMINCMQHPAIA